jgi:hypothetical protein
LGNDRQYSHSQLTNRKAICRSCVQVDTKLTQDRFNGKKFLQVVGHDIGLMVAP